jgi:hypothetical protein
MSILKPISSTIKDYFWNQIYEYLQIDIIDPLIFIFV